jgi:hypothetical protein
MKKQFFARLLLLLLLLQLIQLYNCSLLVPSSQNLHILKFTKNIFTFKALEKQASASVLVGKLQINNEHLLIHNNLVVTMKATRDLTSENLFQIDSKSPTHSRVRIAVPVIPPIKIPLPIISIPILLGLRRCTNQKQGTR